LREKVRSPIAIKTGPKDVRESAPAILACHSNLDLCCPRPGPCVIDLSNFPSGSVKVVIANVIPDTPKVVPCIVPATKVSVTRPRRTSLEIPGYYNFCITGVIVRQSGLVAGSTPGALITIVCTALAETTRAEPRIRLTLG